MYKLEKPVNLIQSLNKQVVLDYKALLLILLFILLSNVSLYYIITQNQQQTGKPKMASNTHNNSELYLLDQAKIYVYDAEAFEEKVRKISSKLGIQPEWLMSVMHSESRFDASVSNRQGSGATGLIQWMPATAKNYHVTTKQIRNMNHMEQLDLAYKYLKDKQDKYKKYESLTDLYLAILYPKALTGDFCYTLYAEPSKAYKMNSGLDHDKDGRVTVNDIDKFLKKRYPKAYMLNQATNNSMYAKMQSYLSKDSP